MDGNTVAHLDQIRNNDCRNEKLFCQHLLIRLEHYARVSIFATLENARIMNKIVVKSF